MSRLFLLLLLFLHPLPLSGQQGVILFDRSVQYDFEIPEGWSGMRDQIPAGTFSTLILLFDESASLMMPAPEEEEVEAPEGLDRRALGMATRLRMSSASRSDQEVLMEAFVEYESGQMAETREFMTRKFLIRGTRPAYRWRITGEQSEFLGYPVLKATAVQDSASIEAWFTPEIPVPAGPGAYGGLPGMILSLSLNDGHTVYSASEVNLNNVEAGVIKAPDDGEEVTSEEYEEIVAEKLEEIKLRTRRRGRGEREGEGR
jgi:hypothetical protein